VIARTNTAIRLLLILIVVWVTGLVISAGAPKNKTTSRAAVSPPATQPSAADRSMLLGVLDLFGPDVAVDKQLALAIAEDAKKQNWPKLFALSMKRYKWREYQPSIAKCMLHADKTIAQGAWDAVELRVDDAKIPDKVTRKLMASTDPDRVEWAMKAQYAYRGDMLPELLLKSLSHADIDVVVLGLAMIGNECLGDSLEITLPESRRYCYEEGDSLFSPQFTPAGKQAPVTLTDHLVEAIASRLKHSDVEISTRAAALLYRNDAKSGKSVTDILRVALKSKLLLPRLVAMTGIRENAKPFLKDFDLLSAARGEETSLHALAIIACLGDPAYMPALIESGRKAEYYNKKIMRFLIRSGDKQASEIVFEKFKKTDPPEIANFVGSELVGMKGPGAVKFIQWALARITDYKRDLFTVMLTLPDPSLEDAVKNTIKSYENPKTSDARGVQALGVVWLAKDDPKGWMPKLRKIVQAGQLSTVLAILTEGKPSDKTVKLLLYVAQTPGMKKSYGWENVVYWLPEKAVREQFIPAMSKLHWSLQQHLLDRLTGSLSDKDIDLLLTASAKKPIMQEYLAAMVGVLTTEPSSRRPALAGLKGESLSGLLNAAGDWDNGAEVVMSFVNDTRRQIAIAARRALAYYALGRRHAKLGPPCRDALLATVQDYDKSLNINISELKDVVEIELLARLAAAAGDQEMTASLLSRGPGLLDIQSDLEPIVRKLIDKGRTSDSDLFTTLADNGWISWAGPAPGDLQCAINQPARKLSMALSWAPPAGQVDAKIVKQISSEKMSGLLAASVVAVRWNLPQGKKALREMLLDTRTKLKSEGRNCWYTACEAMKMCMTPEDAKVLLDSLQFTTADKDNDRLYSAANNLFHATTLAAPRETLVASVRLLAVAGSVGEVNMTYHQGRILPCLADQWPVKLTDESGNPAEGVLPRLLARAPGDKSYTYTRLLKAARGYQSPRNPKTGSDTPLVHLVPPWGSQGNLFSPSIKIEPAGKRLSDIVDRIKITILVEQEMLRLGINRKSSMSREHLSNIDLDSVSADMRQKFLRSVRTGDWMHIFDHYNIDAELANGVWDMIPIVLPDAEVAKALRPALVGENKAFRKKVWGLVARWRVSTLAPEAIRFTTSDDASESLQAARVLGELQGAQAIGPIAAACKRQKNFADCVRFACLLRQLGSDIGRVDIDRAIALRTTREFRLNFVSQATSYGRFDGDNWCGTVPPRPAESIVHIDHRMLPWLSDLQDSAGDLLAVEEKRFCLPFASPPPSFELWDIPSPAGRAECDMSILYMRYSKLSPAKLVTNSLPLPSLARRNSSYDLTFADLCQAEQDLEPFFYVQFADRAINLAELHAEWLAWWSANKNKSRQEWWRQDLTQAVGELTDKKWWHRTRAVKRLMRLTGQTVTPPGLFDTNGWRKLQETWRAKLASRGTATRRQWLLAEAVKTGDIKDAAAIKDDVSYLDVLVLLAGFSAGPLAEAACLQLETWPDPKQLIRHSLPWQKSPRQELRSWVQREVEAMIRKQRLLYTLEDLTDTPAPKTQPKSLSRR
jgi:hypothetical protein